MQEIRLVLIVIVCQDAISVLWRLENGCPERLLSRDEDLVRLSFSKTKRLEETKRLEDDTALRAKNFEDAPCASVATRREHGEGCRSWQEFGGRSRASATACTSTERVVVHARNFEDARRASTILRRCGSLPRAVKPITSNHGIHRHIHPCVNDNDSAYVELERDLRQTSTVLCAGGIWARSVSHEL